MKMTLIEIEQIIDVQSALQGSLQTLQAAPCCFLVGQWWPFIQLVDVIVIVIRIFIVIVITIFIVISSLLNENHQQ